MPLLRYAALAALAILASFAIFAAGGPPAASAAGSTPQTITFGSLSNRTFGDPSFIVTASSSSHLAISFSTTGNCTNSGAIVSLTGAGSCTVTASQAGNATFAAATPVPQGFTIAPKGQTINFAPPFPRTFGDAPFNVSATASSGLPVTFATSGQCSGSGASPATITITAAGICTITASQAGNANIAPATDVVRTLTIYKRNQSITFPAVTATYGDAPITLTATASSTLPITYGASGSCSVSGAQLTILAAGSCSLTADQAGDGNFNAAPRSFRLLFVNRKALTITAPTSTRVYGTDNSTAVPAIDSVGAVGLAGSDTLGSLGTPSCTAFAASLSNVGSYPIVCSGLSAPNYIVKYVNGSLAVTKADQTISFDVIPGHTYGDAQFTVNATASSGLSVTLSVLSGPCTVGTAPWGPVKITGAGDCTIRAVQAGNVNYTAAAPVDRTFTIAPAHLTITADNKSMTAGGTVPAFTYSVLGLVNFDPVSVVTGVTCSTDGDTTTPDTYDITCTDGSAGANYTIFAYVAGTLTVNPAPGP